VQWIGARADGKLRGVWRELLSFGCKRGVGQYSTSAERGFLKKKKHGLSDTRNPGARPIAVGVVSQGVLYNGASLVQRWCHRKTFWDGSTDLRCRGGNRIDERVTKSKEVHGLPCQGQKYNSASIT
jgi:hypothetical protein